jgi:mono/diheme cytochrome c family protein
VGPARRLLPVALVVGALAAAGCAAALRQATPEDAVRLAPRWPETAVADLQRGRSLYVRRCSGCHNLVLPRAFPAERWPGLVDGMAARARLGPGEREDVARFLVAVASDRGGGRDEPRR